MMKQPVFYPCQWKHNWSLLLLQRIFHKFHKQLPCSIRKGVLRNFAKFTGKRLCQRLFFNNVADLNPATLFKKRLWHRCFTVNFAKFLRTPLLYNTSGRLLLTIDVIIFNCGRLTWMFLLLQCTFSVTLIYCGFLSDGPP